MNKLFATAILATCALVVSAQATAQTGGAILRNKTNKLVFFQTYDQQTYFATKEYTVITSGFIAPNGRFQTMTRNSGVLMSGVGFTIPGTDGVIWCSIKQGKALIDITSASPLTCVANAD